MTCAGHGPVGNPAGGGRDRGLGSAADSLQAAVPEGQGPGGLLLPASREAMTRRNPIAGSPPGRRFLGLMNDRIDGRV